MNASAAGLARRNTTSVSSSHRASPRGRPLAMSMPSRRGKELILSKSASRSMLIRQTLEVDSEGW